VTYRAKIVRCCWLTLFPYLASTLIKLKHKARQYKQARNVKDLKVEGRENLNPTNLTIVEELGRFREEGFERSVVCDNKEVYSEEDVLEVFAGVYY